MSRKHQLAQPDQGPLLAHEFKPAGDNHRRGDQRCVCGLPRRNRVHQVLPVPALETRA